MEKLTLPDVVISVIRDGQLKIVHNKTRMVTHISPKQLNTWAISQLKKELVKQ